jgi:hypothetical protein
MALLWRRLSLALAILAGLVFSQAPDYLRQYRLVLGAVLGEAAAENAAFEADCKKSGETRDQGVGRLLGDGDLLMREKGFRMMHAPARLTGLRRQAESFASDEPWIRATGFVRYFDPEVARRAFDGVSFAMPPSTEELLAGGVGFALTLALLRLIRLPFSKLAKAVEKLTTRSPIRRPFDRGVA